MNNNYPSKPSIDDIKSQIINHFRNAQQLLTTKNAVNDFHDGDPQFYNIIAEDFRSGITIIDTLIVDGSFADHGAFILIFEAIEKYRNFVVGEYPMTERLLSMLLSDLNVYRTEVYPY